MIFVTLSEILILKTKKAPLRSAHTGTLLLLPKWPPGLVFRLGKGFLFFTKSQGIFVKSLKSSGNFLPSRMSWIWCYIGHLGIPLKSTDQTKIIIVVLFKGKKENFITTSKKDNSFREKRSLHLDSGKTALFQHFCKGKLLWGTAGNPVTCIRFNQGRCE